MIYGIFFATNGKNLLLFTEHKRKNNPDVIKEASKRFKVFADSE